MSTTASASTLVANTLRALRRLSPHNPAVQAARSVAAQLWQNIDEGSLDAVVAACDRDVALARALLGVAEASAMHDTDDGAEDLLVCLSTALADWTEHLTREDAVTRIAESADALDVIRTPLPGSHAHRTAACVTLMPHDAIEVALVDVDPNAHCIWERQLFQGNSSTAMAMAS